MYFGAVYFGEYALLGEVPANPWIPDCAETGDCRPASLLDDIWPTCGDCRLPSALPVEEESPTQSRPATGAAPFGGRL